MSEHPFDAYFRRHGHYPKATLKLTRLFRIEVQVTRGYAIISTYPYGRTTYIPRSKLIALIRWLVPLVKQMDQEHNVEKVFHEYLREEERTQKELKRQKREARASRTLEDQRRAERQKRRYLAAKRRGRRRQT